MTLVPRANLARSPGSRAAGALCMQALREHPAQVDNAKCK